MNKTKTYQGIIEGDLAPKVAMSGKAYLSFILQTGTTLVPCIAFDDVAELIVDEYKKGQSCTVIGNQKSGDDQLYIQHFRSINIETDRIVRLYGSKDAHDTYHDNINKDYIKRGYVKTRDSQGTFYAKKERTLKIGEEFQLKIDYIMDILGPKFVSDALKKRLGVNAVDDLLGKELGFKERYAILLDGLVKRAHETEERQNAAMY